MLPACAGSPLAFTRIPRVDRMTAPTDSPRLKTGVPPLFLSLPLCVIVTGLFVWMRLTVMQDRLFPVSSGVPLLFCLWSRNIRQLYGMSAVLTVVAAIKLFWIMPAGTYPLSYQFTLMAGQLVNIWLVAGVLHLLIRTLARVENKRHLLEVLNVELESSNEELASSNEELAAREEEITRQNEELQSQAEELERQSEELRQQAEETEQQSAELQDANQELVRRERGLQTLLDSGRWLRGDMNELLIMNGICQAAVQVIDDGIQAAAVVVNEKGNSVLLGDSGFGLRGAIAPEFPFVESFAALVLESARTACIEDLQTRPDVRLPQPGAGRPFCSVLGTPIWQEGEPIATLEIYSTAPRQWSEHEFRIAEWLAAQAALALQAIRFQQEIEQKRRAAEEVSIQKTRFLAAVSHDVRTPANAISLLAELVERCASDPTRAHQVPALAKSLWTNARSMVDLVSDVLDLTRLDSGRLDMDVTDFCLSELIRAEVHQAGPLAEEKKLTLRTVLPEKEVFLRSDRTKVARVLSNLISNSVKFTENGEIRVECVRSENGGVTVSVIDTGIGIPGEHLATIFDEFFQIRNPERNREKGAGLGLAICRRILDGLGFQVSVKSLVGIGTTFAIEIPAECVVDGNPVSSGTNGPTAPAFSLEGLSILLVEDHDVARTATAALLSAEGASVSEARTGREAVQLLATDRHEILLLDLNLPDFDGTEILKSLQAARPEKLEHIMVVTGDVRPERIEEVKALGARELIPKPVSIEKIRAALAGAR